MAGRWWQILILWLLISVPLINLIHALIKPTYVATSLLEVDPAQADIFAPLKRDGVESHDLNYLRTQVDVITSNPVLESALANPFVVNLPTIKRFDDPRYELREKLKVEIIADTNLIRIALELPNKDEAVAIVKAVTNSYVVQNVTYSRRAGRAHTETYETQLMKIEKDIDSKRNMLKAFVKKRKAAGITSSQMLNPKTETDPIQPTLSKVTEEQFATLIDRQMQCDLDYLDALSELDAVKAVRERDKDRINEDLATRIEDEFKKGPHVLDLLDQIRESEDLAKSKDPDPPPAVLAAREKLGKLSKDYEQLWASEYLGIRKQLADGDRGPLSEARTRELEVALEMARRKKERFAKQLEQVEVIRADVDDKSPDIAYLNHQLDSLMRWEDQVRKNLEQLKYEAIHEKYRVTIVEDASASKSPDSDRALKYMAATPWAVLFLLLGSFLAQEIRAGRKVETFPE